MTGSLYIHIPFCLSKCLYCDFYSIPYNSQTAADYIKALCREIGFRKSNIHSLRTIYIGGGTPSVLSEKDISKILDTVKNIYSVNSDAEITLEANPKTITPDKAKSFLSSGINRISMGVQSFSDEELLVLGRAHNAEDAVRTFKDIRDAGFQNISIDLIYGIPGQSPEQWGFTLQQAIELGPEHISAYELTPEQGTPLFDMLKQGKLVMPDEDALADMFYKGIETLNGHGYTHYEISNFAKPGFECRHNLKYWDRGEYIGIGAGAHSFSGSTRTANLRDVQKYIEEINSGTLPVSETTEITEEEALNEQIFLGLRKTGGIGLDLFPVGTAETIKKAVKDRQLHGLIELDGNNLRSTRKGLILNNEVICRVLSYIEKNRPVQSKSVCP